MLAARESLQCGSPSSGQRWEIFSSLCLAAASTANHVPDAYHAALAIENGATWITNDRGYARLLSLQWCSPFDPD